VTTPSGLLAWGQAGQYNAVDDRTVITALANTRNGIVKAAVLSAGAGLTVNIAGGWLAVANCGDGTVAVIGSRVTLAVTVPAGPSSGSLTSYIWADVNPDGGTFTINVITPAQAAGRSGVQVGAVTATAGNNAASQMTLSPAAPSFGTFDGLMVSTAATGGTAYVTATKAGALYVSSNTPNALSAGTLVESLQDGAHRTAAGSSDQLSITPHFTIPPGDMVAWSHYKLHVSGQAKSPNPAAVIWFDVNFQGSAYARVTFASGVLPVGTAFNYWIDAHAQIDLGAGNVYLSIKADITAATGSTFTGVATQPNNPVPGVASWMAIRTNLGQQAGATCDSWSSVFQRFGGQDPTGQITP
jgi:hypothetical protein